MLGDVSSGPFNGVGNGKNAASSLALPANYGVKIFSYQALDTSRMLTLDFGYLSKMMEDMLEDQGDELRNDTEWEATSKDLRDAQKPYDTADDGKAGELYSLLIPLKPFEPVVSGHGPGAIPSLQLSKLAEIEDYGNYEPSGVFPPNALHKPL
jgi:hypothetical protein